MDVAAGWTLQEKTNGRSSTCGLCLALIHLYNCLFLITHPIYQKVSCVCVSCTVFRTHVLLRESCRTDCVAAEVYFQRLAAALKGRTAPVMTAYRGRACICQLQNCSPGWACTPKLDRLGCVCGWVRQQTHITPCPRCCPAVSECVAQTGLALTAGAGRGLRRQRRTEETLCSPGQIRCDC